MLPGLTSCYRLLEKSERNGERGEMMQRGRAINRTYKTKGTVVGVTLNTFFCNGSGSLARVSSRVPLRSFAFVLFCDVNPQKWND